MKPLKNWHKKRMCDGKGGWSNETRASFGATAISAYLRHKGDYKDISCYGDNSEILTDLLADLFHYAASHGIDMNNNIKSAQFHFEQER